MARNWTPTDLSSATIVARWKITELVTVINGGIDRWDSSVGTAYAYAEAAARRPVYNAASAIDGRAEGRGGANLRLKIANRPFPVGSAPFTFMVVASNGDVDDQNVAFGWGDDFNSAKQMAFKRDRIITLMHGAEIHSEFSTVNRWRTAIGLGRGGSPETVEIRHTGQSIKTASVTPGTADNDAYMFARPNFGDRYLYGAIREVVVYAGAASDDDIARLQGYAAWDNGTTGDLPSNHPYKLAAPTIAGGPSLSANSGAINVNGKTAALLRGYTLPIASAAISLVGCPAALRTTRRLLSSGSAIGLVGNAVTLVRIGRLSISAEQGQVNASGKPLELRAKRSLIGGAGSLSVVGAGVRLARGAGLIADAANFAASGRSASLRAGRVAIVGVRPVQLFGQPVSLSLARRVAASPAIFTVSVRPALLVIGRTATPINIPMGRKALLTTSGVRRLALTSTGSRRLSI